MESLCVFLSVPFSQLFNIQFVLKRAVFEYCEQSVAMFTTCLKNLLLISNLCKQKMKYFLFMLQQCVTKDNFEINDGQIYVSCSFVLLYTDITDSEGLRVCVLKLIETYSGLTNLSAVSVSSACSEGTFCTCSSLIK